MELGKQIKKYRSEMSMSQEELSERVFVSRQTVSNWENDKSYPDVNSLVLLSEVFGVSLDQLIKGDVEKMKEQIRQEDQSNFHRLGNLYSVMFLISIMTPIPLIHFWHYIGAAIWVVIIGITLYLAVLVEKEKKKFDIQTYREITAFMEGKSLSEIQKAREEGKRFYQKILLALGSAVIALLIVILFGWILG